MAWKRGWRSYYQPKSLVWHEHRGTIGKKFSRGYIDQVIEKNFVLLVWKNVHEWPRLLSHFFFLLTGSVVSCLAGRSRERYSAAGVWRAWIELPAAIASRWRARGHAALTDTEALQRPLGGYFRDRFHDDFQPQRLRVLFLSPYPVEPPVHGGAVFMGQTLRELTRHADVHLVALLDDQAQVAPHAALSQLCASTEYLIRLKPDRPTFASFEPHAVAEFANRDLEWLLHRKLHNDRIDVFQIDYTNMGQYAGDFGRIVTCLFEHDVYFQSIARLLRQRPGWFGRIRPGIEYLRALRWELKMLARVDQIQVCTTDNGEFLRRTEPALGPRLRPGLRAGIDTSRYPFRPSGRTPETILFLGSFRHLPNREALLWLLEEIAPRVFAHWPDARLIVAGAEPPPRHSLPDLGPRLELRGFVDSVQEAMREPAVFVCPILSGSGVRVKLLEAFAMGIPSVSTRIGAEGLAANHGEFCRLATDAASFADQVVDLLGNPDPAMVSRARQEVEQNWDMRVITERLAASYRSAVDAKTAAAQPRIR
jgi:glycosyltransferase involved in cell wall biosynthesis